MADHRNLDRLCRANSAWLESDTVPDLLRRTPMARFVAGMPLRHGAGPFNLSCNLYDRFSAPIQRRYSCEDAAALLVRRGLTMWPWRIGAVGW